MIMSAKRRFLLFLVLWAVIAIAIYSITMTPDSRTRNIPGSMILGLFAVGFFWWLGVHEREGKEFMIGNTAYDTAKAAVVAEGRERSEFLGATWGVSAWQKSQATFYQTTSGALFSVDSSQVLEMALFFPILSNNHSSCVTYSNIAACMNAMTNKNYGNLSVKEASLRLRISPNKA
jgi:hypothetical protein